MFSKFKILTRIESKNLTKIYSTTSIIFYSKELKFQKASTLHVLGIQWLGKVCINASTLVIGYTLL